jgi:hypothetical protein
VAGAVHEATLLALDATLAHQQLVWTHGSRWRSLQWTAQWYQQVLAQPAAAHRVSQQQLAAYLALPV